MHVQFCRCGCVGSTWEHENPFIRQGVAHSPSACVRGVYAAEDPAQLEPVAPAAAPQLEDDGDPETWDILK